MSKNNNDIFRAVRPNTEIKQIQLYRHTMRPPGNVPYVVDNLWEWKRPEHYPNRRYSAFASPKKEDAILSAGENTIAYRVSFLGNYKLCQVKGNRSFTNNKDSKYHPDCKILRSLLLRKLDLSWIDKDIYAKSDIGRLWIPCLRKEEVDTLFEKTDVLKEIRQDIYDAITYWEDVVLIREGEQIPDQEGEIFFEAFDGYLLSAV